MHLINREDIPTINCVTIENKEHNLGIVKDLRRHPLLKNLLPENGRFSLSWTHLKEGEVLERHKHPTESMIIISEGNGRTLGDLEADVKSGDIVFVSPGKSHGFVGGKPNGFWALSIQFEGLGLYEDINAPRAKFASHSVLDAIMSEQEMHLQEYAQNPLVKLAESKEAQVPEVKKKLLAALQLWSNAFQRILFAKAAFGNCAEFQRLSEDHIAEELGHNKTLAALGGEQDLWDPALAAACAWFFEQMFRLSEVEKVVLVHFVLEGSGRLFHDKAKWLFPENSHFNVHAACDDDHFMMGYNLLKAHPFLLHLDPLQKILSQGWRMMNYMCTLIADLAQKN